MSLEDVQTYGIVSTSKLSFPGESRPATSRSLLSNAKKKGWMKWTCWTCSVDVYPHVICVDVVRCQFRFELLDKIRGFESVVMIFQQPWVSIQLDFTSVMTFESPWRYSGIAFGWPHVAFGNLNVSTLATDFLFICLSSYSWYKKTCMLLIFVHISRRVLKKSRKTN